MKMIRSFFVLIHDERGAAMPEYALLLGLIAAIAIGTLSSMGTNINTIFTKTNSALASAASR